MRAPRRLKPRALRHTGPPKTWGALWQRVVETIRVELGPRGTARVDQSIAAYLAVPAEDRVAFDNRTAPPPVPNPELWQVYILAVHKGARTPDGQDTTPVTAADLIGMPGPTEDAQRALRHYADELRAGRKTGDVLRAGHAAVAVRGLALGLSLLTPSTAA